MISPTFVEANYEVLESLLRERRKQMHNEDLRTELEYFSEEYEEEREMEPRPARGRKEFRRWNAFEIKSKGQQASGSKSPPAPSSLLRENLQPSSGPIPTYVNPYPQPNMGVAYGQPLSYLSHAQGGNPTFGEPPPIIPMGDMPHNLLRIEDYPLLDGLKMPSHVGSYDEKGDPDNYLHLFKGAIRSILNYEDLKAKFWSHFSQQKKFTKTHLAVHNIKQREGENTRAFVTRYTYDALQILGLHEEQPREVATNGTPNDHREGFDGFKKNSSWDNNKGKKNRDKLSLYRGSNHGILSNLSKSSREIIATEKVGKTFKQPPRLIGSRRSRDKSKYCHFHEDHGHDTNQCREVIHQIEEAVKLGKLAHLVKGIKKGKEKVSDT
ncbi:hypothetical protein Tco_1367173 [Tanacetum coccineum]